MGYYDNAATTPLMPEVKDYIIGLLDMYGNPSSTSYGLGASVRNIVEDARQSVANFIGARPDEITFTSGGSASNTLGIMGWVNKQSTPFSVLYSSICHKSIRLCMEEHGGMPIPVSSEGLIDKEELLSLLESAISNSLVVLSMADSEIGAVQDNKTLIDMCHAYGATVMLDATGYIPSYNIDVQDLDCDILTFSGHKLGTVKGVGVLYKKPGVTLAPLIYGAQENGLFGGTENVIGIASLGKACEIYKDKYHAVDNKRIKYLWESLRERLDDVSLIGPNIDSRLPHNLFISIKGIKGADLIGLVDDHGYQISAGSACNTGNLTPSPTLQAIGLSDEEAFSCIRITVSGNETYQDINTFCDVLSSCVKNLRWVSSNG